MLSVWPSPQLIVQEEIVSAPGSLEPRLTVYEEPSSELPVPVTLRVGATLCTWTIRLSVATWLPESVTCSDTVTSVLPSPYEKLVVAVKASSYCPSPSRSHA